MKTASRLVFGNDCKSLSFFDCRWCPWPLPVNLLKGEIAVSCDWQVLASPRRLASNQFLSSLRSWIMNVCKLRIFHLAGTMVLCNGFRITHWGETGNSRSLCLMWLWGTGWEAHLQVSICGLVGTEWRLWNYSWAGPWQVALWLDCLFSDFVKTVSVDLPTFMYFPCDYLLEKTREFWSTSVH